MTLTELIYIQKGCTCHWRDGMITRFDEDCPVQRSAIHRPRRPEPIRPSPMQGETGRRND